MINFEKVLFVGLGGAGQRHLRIFREILPSHTEFIAYRSLKKTPMLQPNFAINRHSTLEETYNLNVMPTLDAALKKSPDLVVISTPTALHREAMFSAALAGCGVFVEKPWAESSDEFERFRDLIEKNNLRFNISFQRRYHRQIILARKLFMAGHIGKPIIANFTVFSDLRTWHPYEDWRKLYAVRPELGGGVLQTEIHEIDLVYWFFGLPEAVFCVGGNYSEESLNVEDSAQLTLIYRNFCVSITVCFLHNKPSRSFYISGTNGNIVWDDKNNHLMLNGKRLLCEGISGCMCSNDQMFVDQAKKFVSDWSMDDTKTALNAAGASLAIVEAAIKSMRSGSSEAVDPSLIKL